MNFGIRLRLQLAKSCLGDGVEEVFHDTRYVLKRRRDSCAHVKRYCEHFKIPYENKQFKTSFPQTLQLPSFACVLLCLHCPTLLMFFLAFIAFFLLVLFLAFVAFLCLCSSLPSLPSSIGGLIGFHCLPLLVVFLAFIAFTCLCFSWFLLPSCACGLLGLCSPPLLVFFLAFVPFLCWCSFWPLLISYVGVLPSLLTFLYWRPSWPCFPSCSWVKGDGNRG